MKKLILIALCAFLPLVASTAQPVVVIENDGNVRVDGVNFGAVADAIANNPPLAPAIQAALGRWFSKVQDDARVAREAAIAAARSEYSAAVAEKEAERRKAVEQARVAADASQRAASASALTIGRQESYIAKLRVYIAALRGTLAGLGGTSDAPPEAPAP